MRASAIERAKRRWFERIKNVSGLHGFIELPKACGKVLDMAVCKADDDEVLIVMTEGGPYYLDDGAFVPIEPWP